mmetsp:Transcript_41652/g.98760  ORF Transcript_41652/g.98760 Transcript_41652/m.98760 type:complete len:223 (-) Transcript_41652:410-1078(-)
MTAMVMTEYIPRSFRRLPRAEGMRGARKSLVPGAGEAAPASPASSASAAAAPPPPFLKADHRPREGWSSSSVKIWTTVVWHWKANTIMGRAWMESELIRMSSASWRTCGLFLISPRLMVTITAVVYARATTARLLTAERAPRERVKHSGRQMTTPGRVTSTQRRDQKLSGPTTQTAKLLDTSPTRIRYATRDPYRYMTIHIDKIVAATFPGTGPKARCTTAW